MLTTSTEEYGPKFADGLKERIKSMKPEEAYRVVKDIIDFVETAEQEKANKFADEMYRKLKNSERGKLVDLAAAYAKEKRLTEGKGVIRDAIMLLEAMKHEGKIETYRYAGFGKQGEPSIPTINISAKKDAFRKSQEENK